MNYRRERIEKISSDINSLINIQNININDWIVKEGTFYRPEQADAAEQPFENFNSEINQWIGNDRHYWFRTTVTVPQSFNGKSLWLYLSTQKTFWDAINPQFLVFINGEVIQGADANHREIKICDNAKEGDKFIIDLQAYTGRDSDISVGSSKKLELYGSLLEVDEKISKFYYDMLVPYQIIKWLDEQNTSRLKLEMALEKTINLLDLRKPYSKEFYNSLEEAEKCIQYEVYEKLAGNDDVIATCIGHTHIDVAWWWTVEQTREKVVRSFATVLKLMDEFPEYKFMSSQPQIYKFLKQRYPEIFEKIKQKIKEGRWEAEGGMWLEADCNVTSGESLVRQFLHGKQFFKEEFGLENHILWLPDVFGYSAALPQIMKKSGIDYFMTTKIAWNQTNRLPYDTFWWKGIDGSEMFTHLITTQDMNQSKDSFFTTYNGNLNAVSLIRAWERYQQKEINNDVLISYGYGDGGGGPTREMIEIGKRMTKGIIASPKVRFEMSRKYFDELYERAANNRKMPKWVGELYLEYHRGTYTSMARNKRGNRKCELLWQDVEFFSTWAEKLGVEYPKSEIYNSWETILLNQFHDILPGSSIKEVYDVTKIEYEELETKAKKIIADKIQILADNSNGKKGDIVLFNSLSFDRNDIAIVDCDYTGLMDSAKNIIPTQKSYDGKLLVSSDIPSKGIAVYTPCEAQILDNPFIISEKAIETPDFSIEFDDSFQFKKIYDKYADRQVLGEGKLGNVLKAYEDKPMYYDNWDIDVYYTEKSWTIDNVVSAEWIEKGPLRATLFIKRQFVDSIIEQKIHFYSDRKEIEFETYIDWKQYHVLIKAEFDVEINATEATYDIQFGNIKRPNHKNTSWDQARFEVCAHKWADLSEDGYGVSILNDCKYGHSIHENKIGLTLLKSGTCPTPDTDQEEHRFIYSLYPHMGDYKQADTSKHAYMLNVPIHSCIKSIDGNNNYESFTSIDSDNVIIETIKKSEDNSGIIVRAYENKNRRNVSTIKWNCTFVKAIECDLMENELEIIAENSNSFTFNIKPFEIKTFKILN